ncbi:MAG: helix-turn-helix transcriptional regulator [Polyangiaceae bacterium]
MFRCFPPHPSLAHLVRSYGALDYVHTELTAEHRLYPECTVLLTFLHGESYLGVGSDLKRLPSMYLQEFRDFPLRLRSCGRTRMVGVEFYPWGAFRLLGPPTSNTVNPCAIPAQVSAALAARIQRLLAADQQDEALNALEEWLLARATRIDLEPTPAVLAATRVLATRGLGTVTDLADGVGLSVRQLERQFRAQVGMSPKTLARLTRFEAAQQRIYKGGELSLTRLAHDLGYADQAHFTREFRAFADQTPGRVLAEAKEFLRRQGDVAFVQAERAFAS